MKFEEIGIEVDLSIESANEERPFAKFDGDAISLCRAVEEAGSLNKAAKALRVPYSRVWRTLRKLEQAFGIELLETDGPKGTVFTREARNLLYAYDQAQKAAEEAALKAFLSNLK